jgi:hypothetical protein
MTPPGTFITIPSSFTIYDPVRYGRGMGSKAL